MPMGSILQLRGVLDLITETPIAEDITAAQLYQVIDSASINAIGDSWTSDPCKELLKLLRSTEIKHNAHMEDLYLAGLVFPCENCAKTITFPRVLYHSCCVTAFEGQYEHAVTGSIQDLINHAGEMPWSPQKLCKPE